MFAPLIEPASKVLTLDRKEQYLFAIITILFELLLSERIVMNQHISRANGPENYTTYFLLFSNLLLRLFPKNL